MKHKWSTVQAIYEKFTQLAHIFLIKLMEKADASSGSVWVLDQEQSFRLVTSRGTDRRSRSIDPGEIIHRHEEIFMGNTSGLAT